MTARMLLRLWSSLQLRSKGLVVVGLPIVPLAVLWTLIGLALLRDNPPAPATARAREVQAVVAQPVSTLLDAESGTLWLVGFLAASVACTAAGVAAALVLAKGIQRRIAMLAVQAQRLAAGEPIEDVPEGGDEIALLGARLRDASRLLRQREGDLREMNRELEAFSYSVSHDLRAPLRAIDGFSQIIEEDQAARLDDEGRDALRRVRAAARKMGTLIDELLNLARITRAELHRERVDLSAIASGIVSDLQRGAPNRPVQLFIGSGLIADGDPDLLQVALQNLLHNAWKYTGRTADARIELGAAGTPDRRVFHVRDNGAGFDMTYASRLFGAFQRMHTDRDFEGTGVGLATVQRIIHRHGGRIWAESAVGAGATFYFTLGPEAP